MLMKQPLNTIKQEVTRAYNSINQEIFGMGVRSQRIDFVENKIYISAIHKRIPALKILDECDRTLTIQVDKALIEANKRLLREQLELIVGVPIKTILKDYDPQTEYSVTVIIFMENLESNHLQVGTSRNN